jgi:hypothetical protein
VELPLQSVTVTVMELIPGPSGVLHAGDWVIFSEEAGQQLSLTVKKFITQGTRQLVTLNVAGPDNTGPVLSTPMTWTVHWLELPQRSVTVTTTLAEVPETIVPWVGDCEYTKEQSGVQLSVALTETYGMTN